MIDTDTDLKTAISCKNGELVVKRTQDTTPYLDANVREFNEAPTWRPYARTRARNSPLRKVAEIPNIVVEQWLKEGINIFNPDPSMQRAFRAKLDDYTNQKLRTFPGRLGTRKQWV